MNTKDAEALCEKLAAVVGEDQQFAVVLVVYDFHNSVITNKANVSDAAGIALLELALNTVRAKMEKQ